PDKIGVTLGEEGFVIQRAGRFAFTVLWIINVDHQRRMVEHADGSMHDVMEFAVGDQYLGLAVLQHESDGLGVQAHVQGVEDRTDHRHTEVGFEHFRDVRQDDGYRVALADTTVRQGRGQTAAAGIGLGPGAAYSTVHHSGVIGIDTGCALDKSQRRQGSVVHGGGRQAFLENGHGSYPVWRFISSCLERMRLSLTHSPYSWIKL